jgi:hypothetical protein
MIAIELITVFMWICIICDKTGYYRAYTSFHIQIKGSPFRMGEIRTLLGAAFLLDPVNIFLYTWQFLEPLERSEASRGMNKTYRYYRLVSIWFIPPAFVGLVAGIVLSIGN